MRKILVASSSMFLALICLVFFATTSGFTSKSKFLKTTQSSSFNALNSDTDTDTDTDDEEFGKRDKKLKDAICWYEVVEDIPGGGHETVKKLGVGKFCLEETGYTCRRRDEVACGPDTSH